MQLLLELAAQRVGVDEATGVRRRHGVLEFPLKAREGFLEDTRRLHQRVVPMLDALQPASVDEAKNYVNPKHECERCGCNIWQPSQPLPKRLTGELLLPCAGRRGRLVRHGA